MAKRTRSAKGTMVDFDLFRIREQIANAPTPTTVAARENFVEQRLKRRTRRLKREVISATTTETTPITNNTEDTTNASTSE